MLRLVLITALIAAFLITRQGILDPRPRVRKPLTDKELRTVLAGMTIPAVSTPHAGSREHRLATFGKKLFFDPGLSSNGRVSCANCHQPDKSFTDGLPVAKGVGTTARNAPTIVNSRFAHWFFWDGRADSLADQAVGPLENPDEHGLDRESLAATILRRHAPEYHELFGSNRSVDDIATATTSATTAPPLELKRLAAYTLATIGPYDRMKAVLSIASDRATQPATLIAGVLSPATSAVPAATGRADRDRDSRIIANAVTAIAAWERLLIADQSPFDAFARAAARSDAPLDALSEEQATGTSTGFSRDALAGLRLFTGRANCVLCHRGPLLSDQQFHNIGLGETDRLTALSVEQWVADVAGRAKGQIEVRASEFNCRAGVWGDNGGMSARERMESESCREQEFADVENYEAVGAFKTPTLRNVALTAPYFHDGRASSLDDVLDHYDKLAGDPVIGHREESLRRLDLTSQEKTQLKAFLESLTSPVRDLGE